MELGSQYYVKINTNSNGTLNAIYLVILFHLFSIPLKKGSQQTFLKELYESVTF